MSYNGMRKAGMLGFAVCLIGVLAYSAFAASHSAFAASTVTINGATKYQTIDGFGFSEAFGRASSMATASSSIQKQMTDLLFSTSNGAGFTILRNIISSDSSSIEPNNPGGPNATPQYRWDGSDTGQVWLSKQALSYGVNQIYADAWSAPGYMKTNNSEANGGALCGVPNATCSSGDWRQAYANYLVQYIKDYQSEGITLSHIGFVNEPDLSTSYSSMVMNAAQTADFVKVLGPTLRAANLSTKLVCCEPEGWNLIQSYTNAITSDATANAYADVISAHGYTGAPNFVVSGIGNRHIWQTEWANFDTWNPAWDDGSAAAGFTWAQRIYTGLTSANLSAFLHWWGVNTSNTNSGLLHLNGSTVEISKRFWAFANYSRFIRPGAVRIAASASSGLNVSSFINTDGSVIVVALNTASSSTPVSFTLQNAGVTNGSATPYLTNGSNDLAAQSPLSISGGAFSATIPARSLVTYKISGSSTGVTPTPTQPGQTPTPTPTPTHTPTPTPGVTPTPTTGGNGGCSVHYSVNQWPGGFTANISFTTSTALNGWTLTFTFPGSQQVQQGWNGQFSQSGQNVTITNMSWNANVPANGTVNPGFNGSWSGSNPNPTSFKLNGVTCSVS